MLFNLRKLVITLKTWPAHQKLISSDAASPTPLGSNTFLPPTGSASKEDDEQQEGITKKRGGSISPTLSWSVAKQAGDTTIKASTPVDRATNLAVKGDTVRSRNGYADTVRIRSHLDKDVPPSKGGMSQGETEVRSEQRLDGIISLCEHHVPQAPQAPKNLSITPRGELQQSAGQSGPRELSVGPYSRIDESSKPFGSDGALSRDLIPPESGHAAVGKLSDDLPCADQNQEVLSPKALQRKAKRIPAKGRSTSDRKRTNSRKLLASTQPRSVSPTIVKKKLVSNGGKRSPSPRSAEPNLNSVRNKGTLQPFKDELAVPYRASLPPINKAMQIESPKLSSDADMVDIIKQLEKEEAEAETAMKADISDAVQKWCRNLPPEHVRRIAHIALKFLKKLNSTICFLVAAYRLLSKAPWTSSMISTDIRHAALYAISRGWYLKGGTLSDFPFSKAELAVAAATYLEQIPSGAPDDPFYTLNTIIDFLPLVCGKLFSQATLVCPHCGAQSTASVPCIALNKTWVMNGWEDIATAIAKADIHPLLQQHGWHKGDCNVSSVVPTMQQLGPWVILQLQPNDHDHFPLVADSMRLSRDSSLPLLDARISGLICTDSKSFSDSDRHYWVVEYEDGNPYYIYDSLEGRNRLTQELAKKFKVFGILLTTGPVKSPVLRTKELDAVAGVLLPTVRAAVPIKVAGRQRIQKVRNELRRKLVGKPDTRKVRKHTLKTLSARKACQKTGQTGTCVVRNRKGALTSKANGSRKSSLQKRKSGTLQSFFTQSQPHVSQLSCVAGTCNEAKILEISDDSADEIQESRVQDLLQIDVAPSDPISDFSPVPRQVDGVAECEEGDPFCTTNAKTAFCNDELLDAEVVSHCEANEFIQGFHKGEAGPADAGANIRREIIPDRPVTADRPDTPGLGEKRATSSLSKPDLCHQTSPGKA